MHWLCRFTIGCVVLLLAATAVRSSPPPNLLFRVPFDAESMLAMAGRGRRDFRYERLDDNAPKRPVFERGKMGTAVRVDKRRRYAGTAALALQSVLSGLLFSPRPTRRV